MSNVVWSADKGWHDGEEVTVSVDDSGRIAARLNILDLPTTADGVRVYMVGRVELRVSSRDALTRVETVAPATHAAIEGFYLNDTEAIEAFDGEFGLS